jgi:diguanylate cyclase (GGDEF)-like protein/PAS domain S-box-containing protein
MSANAIAGLRDRRGGPATASLEGAQAQITLESIGDAVVSTDPAGRITFLNAVAENMTGWSRQEAHGRPLQDVFRIVDGASREFATIPWAESILRDGSAGLGASSVLIGRNGREIAVEKTTAPIRDRSGRTAGVVMVFHDVSARRDMELRMSHLAHHDFLTGLPNRLLLNERLAQTIASAHRHRKALAVMFLDMDGFKKVNDALGHEIGDRLLQSIAKRLVACVRASDTVSRQGGDEFVVLLAEMSHREDAACIADKIVADSKSPHSIGPHRLFATASIGIGVYPADGSDAGTLLRNADLALLRAKSEGRGQYRFCSG